MGRPKLSVDRRRTRRLGVRLRAAEWRLIEIRARRAGVRPTAYVREAALASRVPLALAEERRAQRSGVNLHQEAAAALSAMGLSVSAAQETVAQGQSAGGDPGHVGRGDARGDRGGREPGAHRGQLGPR